jgi:uncharacterized protein
VSETLRLQTGDGLSLEAVIDAPMEPVGSLVFCHPHPKMGGTMNAPLLVAVTEHLVGAGWAVLRFNFRGIGTSEGESGEGIEEVADAAAALVEVRTRFSGRPAIAGWSFGAAVAIRAAAAERGLGACVAIAPAVTPKPGVTAGSPSPDALELDCPLLVVCGENDELVDPSGCAAWARAAGARYVQMRGANHFFWAKYDDLATTIEDFLKGSLS